MYGTATLRDRHARYTYHLKPMMKEFKYILLSTLMLISCHSKDNFDIYEDLHCFSEKLQNDDTLLIDVNTSLCACRGMERNTITKGGCDIWMETVIDVDCGEKISKTLDKVKYSSSEKDSLTFEYFFRSLSNPTSLSNEERTVMFRIIHKKDTIFYYTGSTLSDRVSALEKYIKIKKRYYPKEELYEPALPPPPLPF